MSASFFTALRRLLVAGGFLLLSGFTLRAAAAPADENTGRDVGSQGEKDWVDDRWNRTDVGPFIASNLEIAGARIAKALSIRVGPKNDGAVCFDTARCAYRAAWQGGFLQFDPARYGLIRPPKIDGKIFFNAGTASGWRGKSRYTGLRLGQNRVVLEYSVDETHVFDSPWLEPGVNPVFIRSLELASSRQPLDLIIGSGSVKIDPLTEKAGVQTAHLGSTLVAVGIRSGNIQLLEQDGNLVARFAAHDSPIRFTIAISENAAKAVQVAASDLDDLRKQIEPGPARWLPELETVGKRGLDLDILAVDTLTVPYSNPWSALMFLAGVDLAPDGAAYVCTIHGDVWRVTGIDQGLAHLRWKRYATGLFQALGLKIRDGEIFVLGRDQITRLHDNNHDGEADFYENFCNLIETSSSGHDYVTSLEKDDAGNFYFVDPRGVHRIDPDGKQMETIATGFRNANGLGVSPDGRVLTVAPQQGEWTPSSEICEIKAGGYFGYGGPKVGTSRPLGYDAPLCWIPHSVDNSSGSQAWIPPGKWGPLGGQMLHLLWGRCGLMLILRDVIDGAGQGAAVPLPGRFLSGPNRATFNPMDGSLFVAGSTGWQTSAVKDGALHRVRFTGKPVYLPVGWHASTNGLALTFARPLDRGVAEDSGSYAIHEWNYRYAAQYGSKDWSAANPWKEGRDEVTISRARLDPDGRTVHLEIPTLHPVMQMEIKYALTAQDGKSVRGQLWLTLNRLEGKSSP